MATPITLDQLLDIIDEGSPDQRLALAQKLAPMFLPQVAEELRSGNLQDAVANMWPRITVDDADVVENQAGTEVWGGPSRFAVMDFPGATAWIDDDDRNTVHIRTAGGGADCMFQYLVSPCYLTQTLFTFTEGMEFVTASGCTYKGYSTVDGAADALDADFIANSEARVVFICSGSYDAVSLVSSGTAKADALTFIGAGVGHTIVASWSDDWISNSTVTFKDFTITGDYTANIDSQAADRLRFYNMAIGSETS